MISVSISWTDLKPYVLHPARLRYIDNGKKYILEYNDDFNTFNSIIYKDNGSDQTDFETNYKSLANKPIDSKDVSVTASPPFAEPTFRARFNATSNLVTISPNSSGSADFVMPSNLWVYGGEGAVSGAILGDFITAEIYDYNSIIPEPYRPSTCENWPTVRRYVNKLWVMPQEGTTIFRINTYPLIAEVSQYLSLRVTYNTVNSGTDRQLAINYYLMEKL